VPSETGNDRETEDGHTLSGRGFDGSVGGGGGGGGGSAIAMVRVPPAVLPITDSTI